MQLTSVDWLPAATRGAVAGDRSECQQILSVFAILARFVSWMLHVWVWLYKTGGFAMIGKKALVTWEWWPLTNDPWSLLSTPTKELHWLFG